MSNKKRTILFLISLLALSANKMTAQNNPYNEVSISSPTAASLGKYADIPVSYHTGIPQVSIPIYTVKEGPLSLPISMSYHASGLKVMEPAGWVGAGWSLNAGGVITRTVQGTPDERQTSNTWDQLHGHLSDGGYNKYFWIPTEAPPQEPPAWAPKYERQDWEYFALGKKDGEPDLFFFNFAGYSGKFYFHDDGTAVLVPEQDIKIEYNYTPGFGNSIESFTITTPDGTKYYFGKTADTNDIDPIEKTNPFNSDVGLSVGTAISSWYLNKIVSADDLFTITLSYVAENYSYYTISLFPVPDAPQSGEGHKPVKNMMTGVRLSQVMFSNGKIDFNASATPRVDLNGNSPSFVDDANTEAKSLASIQVSNSSETNCKKFVFSYSYFDDNSSVLAPGLVNINTDRKRLKLNTLQEQSCEGSIIIPAHQFEYFTELVPRRLSFAQDHWGFINYATGNSTMIPTYTLNTFTTINGANRDAGWPAMRGGSMKKITYPTGGYSEFEFEPNYTWVSYDHSVWALRFSINAGYDGSSLPVTQYQPFTSNSYRVTFTNSSVGSQALLSIFNSSDVEVKGYVLELGQSFSEIIQLPAGTYRIVIRKLNAVSGNGAEADFEEWAYAPVQKNETVGGLRIKKLTVNDGLLAANNIITSYAYEFAAKSTGILYSRPAYVFKLRNDVWRDIGFQNGPSCSSQGCISCDGHPSVFYYKSPSGIRPMETTQGNHIGYHEVKVSKTGNGYSIYRYYGSNLWDANTGDVAIRSLPNTGLCEASITNFPFAPLPHEFMRGELKFEGHFNESGQELKSSTYYPVYQNNPKTTPAFIASVNPGTTGYLGTFYTISTAKKTQTGVNEVVYTPEVGSVQTSSYSYFESAFHNQPTRKTTISSTGQTLETKIKYAADFRIPDCDAISDCLPTYNADLTAALNLYNSRKLSCADQTCSWWGWQAYIKDLSTARSNYVNCRKTNYTGSINAFNTCLINNKNTADSWLKPILELHLQFNNSAVEASNWRTGELVSASFNKFDYATVPVTKPYLSKILSIDLTAPSSSFTPANTSSNSITKDSRYKDETAIKFYSGNLVELTPKTGVTTSYIWGYNNILPVVKAVGVDHNTLKTAYDAVSGNLSLLRNQSSLNAALVNTYVYDPFIGITKETNPNSRDAYYEYDKLQRMILVRDHDNNILKKFCYNYAGQQESCLPNTTAQWQSTGNLRCAVDGSANNTGFQQREERDVNTSSATYNQTRWVDNGYNVTACPLPPSCNYSNCYSQGESYACINGQCEQGYRINTGSYYNYSTGMYECTYHYEFSDGSWSLDYTEYNYYDCYYY